MRAFDWQSSIERSFVFMPYEKHDNLQAKFCNLLIISENEQILSNFF